MLPILFLISKNLSPQWERKFFSTREFILEGLKNRAGVQDCANLIAYEPPLPVPLPHGERVIAIFSLKQNRLLCF